MYTSSTIASNRNVSYPGKKSLVYTSALKKERMTYGIGRAVRLVFEVVLVIYLEHVLFRPFHFLKLGLRSSWIYLSIRIAKWVYGKVMHALNTLYCRVKEQYIVRDAFFFFRGLG